MNDGILFFPHEVITPDPIKLIQARFGIAGYGIIYKLFERIYSLGYYTNWDDDVCLIFSDECRLTPDHVQPVVDYALLKGIFSAELYEKYGILTSADIQSKFFFAARKRDELKLDNNYLLVDVNTILCSATPSNVYSSVVKKQKNDDLFKLFCEAKDNEEREAFVKENKIFEPWLEQFEALVIAYALAICIRKNKRNLDYLFGILGNWKKKGYVYIDQIDDPILSVPDFLSEHGLDFLYKSHLNF